MSRVILWSLLFVVALADAVRHRHIKRRGSQLPWGIVAVLGASMVQEILLLTYSVLLHSGKRSADDVRKAYYVFDDLEDSMFMVTLQISSLTQRALFISCMRASHAWTMGIRLKGETKSAKAYILPRQQSTCISDLVKHTLSFADLVQMPISTERRSTQMTQSEPPGQTVMGINCHAHLAECCPPNAQQALLDSIITTALSR